LDKCKDNSIEGYAFNPQICMEGERIVSSPHPCAGIPLCNAAVIATVHQHVNVSSTGSNSQMIAFAIRGQLSKSTMLSSARDDH